MNDPGVLFHYTSIENLAYILESKSFRFNRMDKMDDMLDGTSNDVSNISKFFFISSWTKDSKESISMWNMYTPDMKGIRIELPEYPFSYYDKNNNIVIHDSIVEGQTYYPGYSFGEVLKKTTISFDPNTFLVEVEYDDKQIVPNFVEEAENQTFYLRVHSLPKVKSEYWSFQKEVRYVLNLLPVELIRKKNLDAGMAREIYETHTEYKDEYYMLFIMSPRIETKT